MTPHYHTWDEITPLLSATTSDVDLLASAQDWPALRAYFFHSSSDLTLEAVKAIVWCRLFLSEYFRDPSPLFHYDLMYDYLSPTNTFDAAPRGHSKTTLLQGGMCYDIANQRERFIVVIEKSFMEAAEVLEMPRRTFADNALVRSVYGDLSRTSAAGQFDARNPDAQGDLLINGVRLRAKGFNTPIRGLKSAEYRPTKIIGDDVESDEHIRNEEQRRKYRENYAAGIVPAVDIEGRIKMFGTILHQDSLLKNLIEQFGGRTYAAYDPLSPATTLLWPERWSLERLEDKRTQMEIDGSGISKFSQEFLNNPVDDLRRAFPESTLSRTYVENDLKLRSLNRYIAIDAALSKSQGADDTGITVVDVDAENNWFVRYVKGEKLSASELINRIFELHKFYRPQTIGVEKVAFEFQILPYLKIKSQQENVFPHVVELKHGGQNKEDRVRGALQGMFENGKIYFAEDPVDDTLKLKGQLRDFPMGKHDDLLDALAYIQQIAKRPAFAPSAKDSNLPSSWKEFFSLKKKTKPNLSSRL